MFFYFGYGSNMNLASLRAKGVEPEASERATLREFCLEFSVKHWFPHEGGVGNVVPSHAAESRVEGVVHTCRDEHLALLDAVESYGTGYDRLEVEVDTQHGPVRATTYIGLPDYVDKNCLPTQRYLNIVVRGAEQAGLSEPYQRALRCHPVLKSREYPPFVPPDGAPDTIFSQAWLAAHPHHTALAGHVFDMSQAPRRLQCLHTLFGGKDMTLFHLSRLDTSDGHETSEDLSAGRLTPEALRYVNAYLHNYALVFDYVGRYDRKPGRPPIDGP